MDHTTTPGTTTTGSKGVTAAAVAIACLTFAVMAGALTIGFGMAFNDYVVGAMFGIPIAMAMGGASLWKSVKRASGLARGA